MTSIRIILAVLLVLPVTAVPREMEQEEFRSEARTMTGRLAGDLMERLQSAMRDGGPPQAITVCRDQAPAIKMALSLERGWRVSRVGTRVRNPLLGAPDAWEREVLTSFQERHEEGEEFAEMDNFELVTEGDEAFYRYMRPIAVQSQCLVCHGDREQMSEEIRRSLDERYPHDQAYGYEAGELRGAFTIKAPVN
ncbi:DUF3365 domain-containing protein [Gammaproteobacteria bacterium AB-CW1]|uniref:DUF3365 domain-containing protein n=1 Tax=Natronospira elongata TaxID=3110268 RepID=A0AAP6JFB6_9GAMM|nr:DUF3365 domain-containing protein [Gammaproteobacteria bacterium AB-CW1]